MFCKSTSSLWSKECRSESRSAFPAVIRKHNASCWGRIPVSIRLCFDTPIRAEIRPPATVDWHHHHHRGCDISRKGAFNDREMPPLLPICSRSCIMRFQFRPGELDGSSSDGKSCGAEGPGSRLAKQVPGTTLGSQPEVEGSRMMSA